MSRILAAASAAAMMIVLGPSVFAQTTVTETTETMTTYAAPQGEVMAATTRETTTVTVEEGKSYASDTYSETTADTSNYSRFFDDAGNPIYLPDVSFSLE